MGRYILARLITSIPAILGVMTAVFFLLRVLPGDPTAVMAADFGASAEDLERMRGQLGLDEPLIVQYIQWMADAARGDLGRSIFTNRTVTSQIVEQLPSTAMLAVSSLVFAILFGLPLGVIAALRHGSWADALSMMLALIGVSMPSFWMGILLIYIFALKLGWLPSAGVGGWKYLLLPSVALGLNSAAIIARLVRSSMLEVMRNDYIVVARAKGLAGRVVLVRHALKNALIPVTTMIGLQFSTLLGGAVIVETVFARKGLGSLAVSAILEQDYPLVQGTILFVALAYILVNIVVDLLYAYLDPRIRYS